MMRKGSVFFVFIAAVLLSLAANSMDKKPRRLKDAITSSKEESIRTSDCAAAGSPRDADSGSQQSNSSPDVKRRPGTSLPNKPGILVSFTSSDSPESSPRGLSPKRRKSSSNSGETKAVLKHINRINEETLKKIAKEYLDAEGNTILVSLLLEFDFITFLEFLEDKNIDVNIQNIYGVTVLHKVCLLFNEKPKLPWEKFIIPLLEDERTDVTIRNNNGFSAYDLVRENKKLSNNARKLFKIRENINPKREEGAPLILAAKDRDLEKFVELMEDAKTDVNQTDSRNNTVLFYVCFYGLEEFLKILAYDIRVIFNIRNNDSDMPEHFMIDREKFSQNTRLLFFARGMLDTNLSDEFLMSAINGENIGDDDVIIVRKALHDFRNESNEIVPFPFDDGIIKNIMTLRCKAYKPKKKGISGFCPTGDLPEKKDS